MRRSHLGASLLVYLVFAFGPPAIVAAHAELVASAPADGDEIVGNPPLINARYSENLDPSGSSLVLVDATGSRIAAGGVAASGQYPKEMWIEDLPQLEPGVYTVKSTTKSAEDGDIDRATWSFTVMPVPSNPTPEPTPVCTDQCAGQPSTPLSPSPSPSPTAAATSASAGPGSPTSSGSDVVLPIVAALAIITIGAGILLSRGRRAGSA
jgi:methionine-rich copper-binding protein CopC